MHENQIGDRIVKTAINIHRETEPGLLESVYEIILTHQLRECGLDVQRQIAVPIEYKGLKFIEGFRADLVIENKVIVELKCVEKIKYVHRKQLLTYLNLTGMHLGYLLNFSESLMKNGIHRTVNALVEKSKYLGFHPRSPLSPAPPRSPRPSVTIPAHSRKIQLSPSNVTPSIGKPNRL